MIQRIQTVYLFVIAVIAVVLLWLPVMSFTTAPEAAQQHLATFSAIDGFDDEPVTDEYEVEPYHLKGDWGLMAITCLIAALAMVDIFLYKRRILQARLNIFLAVLCVGYYGMMAVYAWFVKMNFMMTWHILPSASIPLICLVLTLMATRAILKDEALVRAADRIR